MLKNLQTFLCAEPAEKEEKMKREKKTERKTVLWLLLCLTFWFSAWGARETRAAVGLSVDSHTQSEIRDMAKTLNPQENLPNTYARTPVNTVPFDEGEVSAATLRNGLNTLNFIRYVAGIPYNVQIHSGYQSRTQAAALVMSVLGGISHQPARPAAMNDPAYDDLYNRGYEGASSSNIASGYSNLYDTLVFGWMSDEDPGNISIVGHRRWCLNPGMEYTGFGVNGRYYAMYAFDGAFADKNYKGVAWPAQNMPVELFARDMPWSISMGSSVDASRVTVTLKRVSDGKLWRFSMSGSDGDFFVNNDNYGQKGCIIFRPSGIAEYKAGDSYQVSVTGTDLSVSYDVNFFKLSETEDTGKDKPAAPAAPVLKAAKSAAYNKIKITWSAVSGADGYRVYRKEPGGKWKALKTLEGEQTSYTDKKAVTGTVYRYTVRAYVDNGGTVLLGAYDRTGIKGKAVLKKTGITKLQTSAAHTNTLKWTKVSGASGYEIWCRVGKKGYYMKMASSRSTAYTHKGLSKGTTYYYRIRAYRELSGGKTVYSAWSAVKSVQCK